MNNKDKETRIPITTTTDAGDAVGVPTSQHPQWFVAIVNNNTERSCAEKLEKMKYEVYIPIQKELCVWKNGKRKWIDRIVLPCLVFIHCTETERKRIIVNLPFINRFMTDRAKTINGLHAPATIPDAQMDLFKYILYASDTPVSIEQRPFSIGDKVRILRGGLTGVEGNIIYHKDGHADFVVQLDVLGYAKLSVSVGDIEVVR